MDLTKVERYQGPADKRSPAAFIRLFEYYTSTCQDDIEKGRYFINRMDFDAFPGSKSYKEKWGYKKMKKIFIENEWNRTCRINLIQKLDRMEFDSSHHHDFLSFITEVYSGLNDCNLEIESIYAVIKRKCPPQYSGELRRRHVTSFHRFNQKIRELYGIYGTVEKRNVLPLMGSRLALLDSEHRTSPSSKSSSTSSNADSTGKKKFILYKKKENTFSIGQAEPEGETVYEAEIVSSDDESQKGVVITDLGNGDASGNE